MNNNKELRQLREKITPVLRQYNVTFAALFGSRAQGRKTVKSDYDILIDYLPNSRFSLLDLIGLQLDLKKVLKTKVDVVSKNALSPYMRREILDTMKIIYDQKKR